jgi:CRP/FNR family transcriptional regulator, cyclic AMP receptor protein
MRAVLKHCEGGRETIIPAGTQFIQEGQTSGRLYVLVNGRLDILKSETVVATMSEPGAIVGEMSVLLGLPHSATVRASSDSKVYEFDDAASFLVSQPNVALLVAKLLAQRLYAATESLVDLKRQYASLRLLMKRMQA